MQWHGREYNNSLQTELHISGIKDSHRLELSIFLQVQVNQ